MIAMDDHVGGAGNASNRNDQTAFRAIVEDEAGSRRSILVLGFTGVREDFIQQLDASERAREVAAGAVSFRRPQ